MYSFIIELNILKIKYQFLALFEIVLLWITFIFKICFVDRIVFIVY